jgi:O-antigen ligase
LSRPRDPFRLALFALTVVTVSRVHQALGLGVIRPALILFLFALGYAVLNPSFVRADLLFRTWPPKVFVALGLMACLSVPFGISIGGSATFIITTYSKTLLFGLLLVAALRRSGDLRFFISAYVISCGILVYFAAFVFGLSQAGSGVARLHGLYTYDSNDLGLVLMAGLPLTLLMMQTALTRRSRILSGTILVGIGVAAALSGSRGAFIGLICVGLALLFTLKQISIIKRVGFVIAAGLSLAIAAPQGYWEQMQTLTNPTEDYNWDSRYGRRQVWTRGLGYFASNPVTGIGVGNFGRAEGTLSEPAQNFENRVGERLKWSVAHNSFLEPLAEMGLPGFVLWSSLVVGGIVSMVRLRRRLPQTWARGDPEQRFLYGASVYIPISLIGFASTAFFVSFAYKDPIYILAAFVAGTHVACRDRLRREGRAAAAPGVRGMGRRNRRIAPPARPRVRQG